MTVSASAPASSAPFIEAFVASLPADLPGRALVATAARLAEYAHRGQVRKYSGEAYIAHPVEVASRLMALGSAPEVVAAALLHDTLEDTDLPASLIEAMCGSYVLALVRSVTDVSQPSDGNRRVRKAMDRQHLADAALLPSGPDTHAVKLADLISNSHSIVAGDPAFARVYMAEKASLLEVLVAGVESPRNAALHAEAMGIVAAYRFLAVVS